MVWTCVCVSRTKFVWSVSVHVTRALFAFYQIIYPYAALNSNIYLSNSCTQLEMIEFYLSCLHIFFCSFKNSIHHAQCPKHVKHNSSNKKQRIAVKVDSFLITFLMHAIHPNPMDVSQNPFHANKQRNDFGIPCVCVLHFKNAPFILATCKPNMHDKCDTHSHTSQLFVDTHFIAIILCGLVYLVANF